MTAPSTAHRGRILALAPFTGDREPAGERRPVTRETLDEAIRALAPAVRIAAGPAALDFAPRALSAFDPESLAASLPDPKGPALDAVLHHPGFQRLEAAWRGLARLLEAADERCVVEIAAASRDTVVDRFHELVYEEEFEDRSTIPLTLVAADFQYGTSGSDLEILGRMAGFGQSLSVLWLAQAAASAFGIKTLYHLGALPAVAERFAEPGYARFTAYKQDPAARWVSLVVNRFLGRERHENETLGYAEAEHAGHPEWRPWANGIWLAAAAYARSLSRHGHAGDLDGLNASGDFEGLPTFPYPTAMNRTEPYGTETMIEDVKSLELVHSGFTPLVGEKGAGRGYFPMVANTYRPEGAVLLDASAAHQLLLGDLVHTLLRRLPETPSGSPDERAAWVRGLVETWAGGFEGERDAEDLTVTAQSEDGNDFVSVFLRLPIRLHNHRPEFTLDLPLGA